MTQTAVEAQLPELTFAVVREIERFPEFVFPVEQEAVEAYCRLTGDFNPLYETIVPPGLAAIFGRLGYLRLHRMPAGGVLLRQEIQWLRPARRDAELTIESRVVSAEEKDDRRKVEFETTASQGGRPVAVVRIVAGWPK